jgi:hypothetical protein
MPWSATADVVGANVLAVVVVRSLPFVVYVAATNRVRNAARVASAVIWAVLAASLVSLGPGFRAQLLEIVLGSSYFVLASATCHWLRHLGQRGALGKLPSFVVCAILFQLVPALLIRGPGAATVHVLGWEMMLAAYSYSVDRSSVNEPRLTDCLFFLLVNPVLVFADRGADLQRPKLDLKTLAYLSVGVLGVTAQATLYVWSGDWGFASHADLLAADSVGRYLRWVGFCATQFFMIYWGMAGVANLQSGLMRSVGFVVADRFRSPFLARSPGEFWERWNTYVADWFRRYVFFAVAAEKRWLPRHTRTRWALTTIVTFTVIGLAHEYAILLQHRDASGAPTLAFVLASVVVTLWVSVGRALGSYQTKLASRSRWAPLACQLGARALFLQVAVLLAWLTIPALSGGGFPPSVVELLHDDRAASSVRERRSAFLP